MKKIAICIFIFALNCAPAAFAQTNALQARIETMFTSFAPGQLEFAIDAFASNSLIPDELVDEAVSQAKTMITLDRPIVGFEFIQEQNVSASVKRLTYILKLSDRPLFWSFSFYRPTNDWVPLRIFVFEEF